MRALLTLAGAALVATAACASPFVLSDAPCPRLESDGGALSRMMPVAIAVEPSGAQSRIAHELPSTRLPSVSAARLLVGVKSAAISGFQGRQRIRHTWADAEMRPAGVSVVFLGCEPDETSHNDPAEWRQALDREKAEYGDLLTHELACRDSYWTLVDKVKGFLQWTDAAAQSGASNLAYVMITDDDVYVDLQQLTALIFATHPPVVPRRRFYGGQVIQTQFGTAIHPLRDPAERNYLPPESYRMHEKPPFATGAHYLLSIDLVRFLARNSDALHGVGTLEDVSVAFWLLALLNVRPVHMLQFDNVRYRLCHNDLIAYADLSPLAMHRIYRNRRENRSFCEGFSAPLWDKRGPERLLSPQLPESFLEGGFRLPRPFRYQWDAQVADAASVLHLVTTISTDDNGTREKAVAVYTPAKDSLVVFCHALLLEAQINMPTTAIPRDYCLEYRTFLSEFLASVSFDAPATSPKYALTRSNLLEDSLSIAVFVQLTPGGSARRTLIECLLAAALTGVHVSVLETAEYAERLGAIAPDIIFITTADAVEERAAVASRVITFRGVDDQFPSDGSISCGHTIEILAVRADPHCRQLYIPIASQSFARRQAHSPVALLEAVNGTDMGRAGTVLFSCRKQYTVASTATDVISRYLRGEGIAIDTDFCQHSDSATLDDDVVRLSKYKFAVVVEDRPLMAGHVSDQIVSAFLAGAIPVYYGHSPTVMWLFNPRAFIDCGSFRSLRACARHVRFVAETPSEYEALKHEPPVVNTTAFVEIFSWHPHVIETAGREVPQSYLLSQRLLTLINNS